MVRPSQKACSSKAISDLGIRVQTSPNHPMQHQPLNNLASLRFQNQIQHLLNQVSRDALNLLADLR